VSSKVRSTPTSEYGVARSSQPDFEWRPSLRRAIAAAPGIGLAATPFVILFGVRTGRPALSVVVMVVYGLAAATLCALIARTHVTVESGRIIVHRIRTRSCAIRDIARLIVVPITYPGLRTATGVVTAIALDASGRALIKVATTAWTPMQVTQFIDVCHAPTVDRVSEVLTPREAMARWPGSYSPRSQWRGYVVLTALIVFISVVGVLAFLLAILSPGTG
jgi:hypothetical protein